MVLSCVLGTVLGHRASFVLLLLRRTNAQAGQVVSGSKRVRPCSLSNSRSM